MRRIFQFRLRTLFVLTALVAVGCVVSQPVVKKYLAYREQQRLRQVVLKLYT
jgi:hypothetical protein